MRKSGIHYSSELLVKDGHEEQFRAVVARFIAAINETESNTLEYIAYITPDGKRCQVDQHYASLDVLKAHLSGVSIELSTGPTGELDQGLFVHADLVRTWIFAADDDAEEVRAMLTMPGIEDQVMVGTAFAGFDRTGGFELRPDQTPDDWRNP